MKMRLFLFVLAAAFVIPFAVIAQEPYKLPPKAVMDSSTRRRRRGSP